MIASFLLDAHCIKMCEMYGICTRYESMKMYNVMRNDKRNR